nr:hypothetical protein [Tanacetum cinerariifolium]
MAESKNAKSTVQFDAEEYECNTSKMGRSGNMSGSNVCLVELCTLRTIVVLKGVSGIRSFVILIETPDLPRRSPQNCPKCGNPVDGYYCQGCALLLKKFKEDLFTYCIENGILQYSSEPSNDNTNVVNSLQEPFVVNQDPGKNSSQSPPQINQHCCYGCGDLLKEGRYNNCPSKVLIVPNPEPFNNQTIKELPPTLASFDSTCYSEDGNSFTYDSTSNIDHDYPNIFDHLRNFLCILVNFTRTMLVIVTIVHLKVTHEAFQCQPMNEDYYHEQNSCYEPNSFGFDQFQPQQYTVNHPIFNVQNDLFNSQNKLTEQLTSICDMVGQFIQKKEEENQIEEEQATNARNWKIPACYDDDDDDYTFAITPKEPDNSLSMWDEHLDTISATKSDEFIKSSVENLVPNLSESEGKHDCDSFPDEDILKKIYLNPLFDEEIISMKIDPHHFNTESDLIESLLNHDSSIISSSLKIDSLSDEFAGELTLLKSIPPGINETDCDPENKTHFIKRLLYNNSSPRPPKEFVSKNSDTTFESFSPSPIPVEDSDSLMEEINLSFTPDDPMPSGIEEDDYDFERDILILEELLSNTSLLLLENESFHFDIPSSSRPPAKPPDGNTGILNVKMIGDISEHKVPMPRLMFTQSILVPKQEKSPDLLPHRGHEDFQPSAECPMMIYGKNTPILDVLCFHFYLP